MDVKTRVEHALERHVLGRAQPNGLGAGIKHGLFPGGARVRPALAIGVAVACGDDRPRVSEAFAGAVECLHCASLVHDDLPCFDDAATRRGAPSVHSAHGEAMAVLVGDALIVLAFQLLSDVADEAGDRLPTLLSILSDSAGMPAGLVSGQAYESEPDCPLHAYHMAKTGALFVAAATGGAAAAGGDVALWRPVGEGLGTAYQIADDIHDRVGAAQSLGKPTGQDEANARPNAVDIYGLEGAVAKLRRHIEDTAAAVPETEAAGPLRALIRAQVDRFVPAELQATFA